MKLTYTVTHIMDILRRQDIQDSNAVVVVKKPRASGSAFFNKASAVEDELRSNREWWPKIAMLQYSHPVLRISTKTWKDKKPMKDKVAAMFGSELAAVVNAEGMVKMATNKYPFLIVDALNEAFALERRDRHFQISWPAGKNNGWSIILDGAPVVSGDMEWIRYRLAPR